MKKKRKTSGEPSTKEVTEEFVERPTLFLDDVVKAVTMDGNLQPITKFYDAYNDTDRKILEEATVKYLNIYNKAFIEIISLIPKSLEKELEMRKNNARVKDLEI